LAYVFFDLHEKSICQKYKQFVFLELKSNKHQYDKIIYICKIIYDQVVIIIEVNNSFLSIKK